MEDLDLIGPPIIHKKGIPKAHGIPYVCNLHKGSPFSSLIFTSNDDFSFPREDPLVITL